MAGLLRIADQSGLVPAVLTLQRQTVLRYPNAAARDAELLNPTAGPPIVWLEDAARFEYWTGTGWTAFGTDASLANRVTVLEGQVAALTSRVAALEARPSAPRWWGGLTAVTLGAEGLATITHGLGVQPQTVLAVAKYQVLGGGAISDVCVIDFVGPDTFTARLANNHGDFQSGSASVWWLAMVAPAAELELEEVPDHA